MDTHIDISASGGKAAVGSNVKGGKFITTNVTSMTAGMQGMGLGEHGSKHADEANTGVDGGAVIGVGDATAVEDAADPVRHGTAKVPTAEFNELSDELKTTVHGYVVATLPTGKWMTKKTDLHKELAWAYVSKENYSIYTPMFYSKIELRFKVEDLNFGELIKFFGCMSMQARRALVHNNSMYIDLTFTDDLVDDTAIENLLVWFQACDWMQQLVQSNRFNGVRIPWTYRAFEGDMFAHLEVESEIHHAENVMKKRASYNAEWDLIKEAFHVAPVTPVVCESHIQRGGALVRSASTTF